MIHLTIKQHLARFRDEAFGPDGDQHRTDDAHQRSSHDHPKIMPPNSAAMASTDVAASAITCT